MKNDHLLARIAEHCRKAGIAETTFGRRAVNDGKLVHRLREGKQITLDTLERIEAVLTQELGNSPPARGLVVPAERRSPQRLFPLLREPARNLSVRPAAARRRSSRTASRPN